MTDSMRAYQAAVVKAVSDGDDGIGCEPLLKVAVGLAAEVGDVSILFDRFLCQGGTLDRDALLVEIGDVLAAVAIAADILHCGLDDLAEQNAARMVRLYADKQPGRRPTALPEHDGKVR